MIVPKDGAPPLNTHFVGYSAIALYVVGALLPIVVGNFHPSGDLVAAIAKISQTAQDFALAGAYASRPGWVAPPPGGKLE